MSVYVNLKCRSCGKSLTGGYTQGYAGIGEPLVTVAEMQVETERPLSGGRQLVDNGRLGREADDYFPRRAINSGPKKRTVNAGPEARSVPAS